MLWEKTALCPSITSEPWEMLLLCRGMLGLIPRELRPVPAAGRAPVCAATGPVRPQPGRLHRAGCASPSPPPLLGKAGRRKAAQLPDTSLTHL